jgi:lysosomal acid lipase/cholesteryl ester hydrolase
VTTEDGYILSMFRIERQNPKGVVLFQPPISSGSIAWLSDGGDSLGFSLWRKGYDVWLTNHRGASYSRQHVNLTQSDPEFWDFSFHEIALYDFDVQFDVIRQETNNSKVIFIGYSMAGTEALIYASVKPEKAEQYVDCFILMAPISAMKHFASLFKYLLYVMEPFEKMFRLGEFVTLEIVRWVALPTTIAPYIVNVMSSLIMGWTPTEMDPVLYPYVFAHHGRGITNKMIYHYGQIFSNQGHFAMYDYGKETNNLLYNSDSPALYPLKNIRNSLYIIYGEKDMLVTPMDVEILCSHLLPKEKVYGKFSLPNHNHIDFMFSRHRRKTTYEAVFKIIDQIENRNRN